jgi:hypothetical protein
MFLSTFALISVLAQAPKPASPPAAGGDLDVGFNPVMSVRNQGTTTTYKRGWHAGASYRIRRIISVIAEASGDYRSAGGHTANIYMYGGGVRFQSGQTDRRVRPFAQALFGGGQDNGFGDTDKINRYPMLTPGGGIDLGISSRAAVRLRLDFPLLMTTGDPLSGQVSAGHTLKCTRLSIGVSFPLGTR